MRRASVLAFVFTLGLAVAAGAQQPEPARKQARAVRVAPGSIVVDGRPDEAAWTQIPTITDFVQKEPVEGGAPTDRMEVKFAYDDTALYVGARMSAEHAAIQSPLGRRDEGDQSEYVLVALDTYLDHRTAYGFGVTAAGVRLDRYHPSDSDSFRRPTPIRCGRRRPAPRPMAGPPRCGFRCRSCASIAGRAGLGTERLPVRPVDTTRRLLGGRAAHRRRSGRRGSASCAVSRASARRVASS